MARRGNAGLRRFLRWFVGLGLVALVVLGAWAGLRAWRSGDPLARLPRAEAPAQVAERNELAVQSRNYDRLTLEAPPLPPIRLTVSAPAEGGGEPAPAVVILGGLDTGRGAVDRIPEHGPNVLVALDWPLPEQVPQGASFWPALPGLVGGLYALPGQVAATVAWLAEQPGIDADRISLAGVSLGAMAMPASHRLAAATGHRPAGTIMAYGGAGMADLLAGYAGLPGGRPVAELLAPALRPVAPESHLARMDGRFLVIAGDGDTRLPAGSARRLYQATPQPKQAVRLSGGHPGDSDAQIARIAEIARTWLTRQGLLAREPVLESLPGAG